MPTDDYKRKCHMKCNSNSSECVHSSHSASRRVRNSIMMFFAISFIFTSNAFAQDDDENDDNPFQKDYGYTDTISFLQCKALVNYEQEINRYIGTRAGISENLTISFIDCPEEKNISGEIEIGDQVINYDDPVSILEGIIITPHGKHLLLFFNDTIRPLLNFVVRNDTLVFSPKFVHKLEHSFDCPKDTVTRYDDLYYILSRMSCADMHPYRVLMLIYARKLIAAGEWDIAEATVKSIAENASANTDNYVSVRCEEILNNISQYKRATVPLTLTDAKKIGTLTEAPIYPPNDNPTVFWQDTLLCVVQSDTSDKPNKMRRYDPVRKQWGKQIPATYPECSVMDFYEVYPCYYCDDSVHYWHPSLTLPGEEGTCDICDCFTDIRPLVSVPSDSTFIFKGGGYDSAAVAKSGGSCIAAEGGYFFNEDNTLTSANLKISWNLLPEEIVSSVACIVDDYCSSYPVVVSPHQNWVVYAVKSKDTEKIELWVAKLNYTNQ